MSRRVNAALLALLAAAFATGWIAFMLIGWTARLVLVLHAAAGVALLLLVPWKSVSVRSGLRRRAGGRWPSVALGIVLAASLGAGFLHSTGLLRWWGWLTAMDVHVGAAVIAIPLAAWHVLARPVRIRVVDLSRRRALRGGVLIGGAAAVYGASEVAVRAARLPGAARGLTGSYEAGSFNPELMPVSSWTLDPIPTVDAPGWRLAAAGRSWGYGELAGYEDGARAVLDCTGGFWSEQDWEGVRLDRLLPPLGSARSIRVISVTGYERRFPVSLAARSLLATRAGGAALSPGHGFPARLVVPGWRGFWWVKWVSRIELDGLPWWWQPPFPLH